MNQYNEHPLNQRRILLGLKLKQKNINKVIVFIRKEQNLVILLLQCNPTVAASNPLWCFAGIFSQHNAVVLCPTVFRSILDPSK